MSQPDDIQDMDSGAIFALLKPVNKVAREALAAAIKQARTEQRQHHLRFYDSAQITRTSRVNKEKKEGRDDAIVLSLDLITMSPEHPRLGWSFGGINRDVCIFSSPCKDSNSPDHFRLSIHPKSGILLLHASPRPDAPLIHYDKHHGPAVVPPDGTIPLLESVTSLALDEFEYNIFFITQPDRWHLIEDALEIFMKTVYGTTLHPASVIDFKERIRIPCGDYHRTQIELGTGTFADAFYAIHSTSGDPYALKDIRANSSAVRQEIVSEVRVQNMVKESPYCVLLLDAWCDKHKMTPGDCPGHRSEHFYLAMTLAKADFSDHVFDFGPGSKSETSFKLIHDVLLGIHHIHQKGALHRDIQPLNLLVINDDPPQAAVSDFGKAAVGLRQSSTTIGPVPYCAPEVWGKDYGPKSDLWSWAFVVLLLLGYRMRRKDRTRPIDSETLARIYLFLDDYQAKHAENTQLVDLLRRILVWDQDLRIDIETALSDPLWSSVLPVSESSEGSDDATSSRKKPRIKANSSASAGSGSKDITQPFDSDFYAKPIGGDV